MREPLGIEGGQSIVALILNVLRVMRKIKRHHPTQSKLPQLICELLFIQSVGLHNKKLYVNCYSNETAAFLNTFE